ncbi:LAME_0E08108g1_1 [Lachancea meyersii CBS 8951]|uniref:LAME_0E08108g1_1 n=1 Tax=Lachancea meyersii CBS 8951 TaxID=1266667 RepID=A0A1G4JIQ2_9SACH|nr:LAME_0E08108g1_1 [Lachancea meyersii CBS 8951]
MSGSSKSDFKWVPTQKLVHGRIVTKFLPLMRHPRLGLENPNYSNLYPGDEVYVFEETTDGRWLRGYTCWQPLPEDFISRLSSFSKELPEQKFKVVVFPRKFVHLNPKEEVTDLPFLAAPEASQFVSSSTNTSLSTMFELTGDWSKDDIMELGGSAVTKTSRPPFPYFRLQDYNVVQELTPMLSQLVTHVYSMYSFGEFEVAENMTDLYYKLDDIRLRLSHKLTTKIEHEQLIKDLCSMSYKIAKLISSKDLTQANTHADTSSVVHASGYGSILCREMYSGKLYNYNEVSPQVLATMSMLCGLSNNFPSANTYQLKLLPLQNKNFESVDSTSILVDFKDALSDPTVNPNFQNLSAIMYLRAGKTTLSEPFILNMERDDVVSVDNISAALFNNIPPSEIDNNKVYLVVVLTETVKIQLLSPESGKGFKKPFVPFLTGGENKLSYLKKGLAAGVIDISRLITRKKKHKLPGCSHQFNVELFGSYLPSKRKDSFSQQSMVSVGSAPSAAALTRAAAKMEENNGWGELVDRIIADANKGIAVNPRILSLSVTVREITGDFGISSVLKNNMSAIQSIPTCSYDTLSKPDDRIYLTLGKTSLCGVKAFETNISSVSIQISSSNPLVTFRHGVNDTPRRNWMFVSVKPEEVIGESIRIDGLKDMQNDETLRISAYINGFLMAKSKFYIKRNDKIIEYPKKSVFQLMSTTSEPLVDLEITTAYVGKSYNVESSVRSFLQFSYDFKRSYFDFEKECLQLLADVKATPVKELIKTFDGLLTKFLDVFYVANVLEGQRSSDEFKKASFTSLIFFLDMVVARQDNYRHLFNDFLETYSARRSELPEVGSNLIHFASKFFASSHEVWDYDGRALCRVSVYLFKLSVLLSSPHDKGLQKSLIDFFEGVSTFFRLRKESSLVDQVLILEAFDAWILVLSTHCDPRILVNAATGLFQACHDKERTNGIYRRPLSVKEQKFVASKFLVMRRLIGVDAVRNVLLTPDNLGSHEQEFIAKLIEWSFEPFLNYNGGHLHLTTIRLADGVLISVIKHASKVIMRNLVRLIPTLCRFFILVRKYCKEKDRFKFRRTFTKLFPTTYPFDEITVDSIVQEDLVVEVLVELATLIASITQKVEKNFQNCFSFLKITEMCSDDTAFNSVFYVTQFAREDLLTIVHTVRLFMKGRFFPSKKWLSLSELFNRSGVSLFRLCEDILIYNQTPNMSSDETLDVKIWSEWVKVLISLGNHIPSNPTLLAEIPRKALYLIGGDYRGGVAHMLEHCWDALGQDTSNTEIWEKYGITRANGLQNYLVRADKTFVREIMEFTFQRHTEARRVGAKVIWGTSANCWFAYGNLEPVMMQTTSELCAAHQSGKFVPTLHEAENYVKALLFTIRLAKDDAMFSSILKVMKLARDLLTVLIEFSEIPDHKEFDDDRTAHQITIFGYLLEVKKPEELHRLVNDLYIYNIKKKDNVQAALSLELLARTYKWDPNDSLASVAFPALPEQSSFQRREFLYKEVAKHFHKGLKLEKALSIYKELAQAYEKINYDLSGLSQVHGNISKLYEDLQVVDRLVPTYFKVTFAGFGFPSSTRNKQFIYEGLPFEHITSMQTRLLVSHPGSKIVGTQEEADNLLVNSPIGKFIHVIAVEPRVEISDAFTNKSKKENVNNKVRLYVENRDLDTFCTYRVLPGATSATDLWVKELTHETASTFPTLMNRAEITSTSSKTLSPIENAIRSMQLKIQDLAGLEDTSYKMLKENGDYSAIFPELSRNISGTIDSPVNGGVSQYREFFTNKESHLSDESQLNLLRSTFDELASILSRCLALHGQVCHGYMKKSHEMLLGLFYKNFADEIERNNIVVSEGDFDLVSRVTSRTTDTGMSLPASEHPHDSSTLPKPMMSSAQSVKSTGSSLHGTDSNNVGLTPTPSASVVSNGTKTGSRTSAQSSKLTMFRNGMNKKFGKGAKAKNKTQI